mmetsp:Transcript_25560/g.48384  ORF Transcript_25560/g.48384 Transcript_25560/m.48384 type:complete len:363 (+) Transcript_25560:70-1158(+)
MAGMMGHERAIANGVFHLISSAMFHRPHLPKTVDVARLIAANTRHTFGDMWTPSMKNVGKTDFSTSLVPSLQKGFSDAEQPGTDHHDLKSQQAKGMQIVLRTLNQQGTSVARISLTALRKLKVDILRTIAGDIGISSNITKNQLVSQIWHHIGADKQPSEVGLKKKAVGNYPMGLKKGNRGSELEGGWEEWHVVDDDEVIPDILKEDKGQEYALRMAQGDRVPERPYPITVSPEEIGSLLHKAKVTNLVILHLDESQANFTRAFVIGTGRSARHLYSAANAVVYLIKQRCNALKAPIPPQCNVNGHPDSAWVAVDAGSVVIHLLTQDERDHYDLEELWVPRSSKVVHIADPETVTTNTARPL